MSTQTTPILETRKLNKSFGAVTAAKDLNVRLRASTLRVSDNARAYNTSGNEVRVFIDYPFDVF